MFSNTRQLHPSLFTASINTAASPVVALTRTRRPILLLSTPSIWLDSSCGDWLTDQKWGQTGNPKLIKQSWEKRFDHLRDSFRPARLRDYKH